MMASVMSPFAIFTFLISLFFTNVAALASTDTITWGGDNSRSGYQTNHNMDPAIVGSAQFGQLFKTKLPGNYNGANEQIFSQPLVYTGADGVQYVYVATTQNNLYKLDAKTGAIVLSKNLHIPFLTADLDGCVDINPLVGITATGVIDPDTDTWYLTAKTYADQNGGNGPQGKPNGRYYVHAISTVDLTERPNFPVDLEGTVARNNPIRSFNGGIHHQRPALLHTGQYIYAGFASHCVQYNFTGWIMGWDKTTGATVERLAMEGAGVPNTTPGGGVWMSGGGLASDNAGSIFFATGNGYASQLDGIPVNGRNPPTSLEEAAVHMTIGDDGSLAVVDFFMPWEKTQLDGADRDLGTSPLELLPSEFSCGEYRRIGVVTGKSGKTYWLNLDDLGGYQNGPNKLDAVIQVYQNENSVYAGAGVYPLEGGYIYINVIQYPTHVFKFSCNNGVPLFTKVADSLTKNAYVLGVGHGTVTSLNGEPGTGLVWVSDVEGYNLRIYNAIPENGLMKMINAFNVPGTTKFTRPVFGDGRVYMGTTQGYFYGFGAPVNLPVTCTSPYNFGTSNLNEKTAEATIQCKALVGITVNSIALSGNANFNITNVPAVPLNVALGTNFTFSAYFNPQAVGPLSSDVLISTTNGVAGYSTTTPISLRGTGQSTKPLLAISPVTVAFEGIVTGGQIGGTNQSVIFTNLGNADLTISNIFFSQVSEDGPFTDPNTTAIGPKVGPFTFIGLPTIIPGNSEITVTINFDTATSGNYAAYLQVNSDGGNKIFDVVGTSGDSPLALVEFQTPDGSDWVPFDSAKNFTFGNVTENTTRFLKLRVTNAAPPGSVSLSLTVSKPPFGVNSIIGASNQIDLGEGTLLAPGKSATATLYCSVPKEQINTDPYMGYAQWTMNVNDPNFGKQFIQFECGAISEQAPPLDATGLGIYRYVGCFKENNPGRQLAHQIYSNVNNTNEMCIAACAKAGYAYCGTQYNVECWGGPTVPKLQVDEDNCNYPCRGNINQVCGGNGVGAGEGGAYISLFSSGGTYTPPPPPDGGDGGNNGGGGTPPAGSPVTNPGVDGYHSVGCYTEGTNTRALSIGKANAAGTVKGCVDACTSYAYAGVEYGGECWCGNSFGSGAAPTSISECNMVCKGNSSEYCGAGSRLNVYEIDDRSSVSIPGIKDVVAGYGFLGCYTEATAGRALGGSSYAADTMTLESCAAFCSAYSYFGVEFGRECYCGNSLGSGSVLAANQADCSFLCPGNKLEYCGAGGKLEMYKKGVASTTPTTTTGIASSTSSFASSSSTGSLSSSLTSLSTSLTSSSTTLAVSSSPSSTLTTSTPGSSSSSTISSAISSSLSSGISITTTSTTTTTTPASPSATLGIKQRIGDYKYLGCYTEATGMRALTGATPLYDYSAMTLEECEIYCSAQRYTYFGVEYGGECYCGNFLNQGSVLAPAKDCSFTCPGDKYEYCGAGNRLEMYILSPESSTAIMSTTTVQITTSTSISTTTTPTTSQAVSSSSSSVVSASSSTTTPSVSSSTSTSSQSTSSSSQSISSSIETSSAQTTTSSTAAVSSSITPQTSSSQASSSQTASSQATSSPTTSISSSTGSFSTTSSQMSSSRSTVNSQATSLQTTTTTQATTTLSATTSSSTTTTSKTTTTTAKPSSTITVISSGNANFTYYSCHTEPSSGRLLKSQVLNDGTGMTIEKCLSTCWNYAYAGVEYGRECWCGNTLTVNGNDKAGVVPGTNVSNSLCSMKCPGNSTEYCGAGSKLSLYYFDVEKALKNSG
ncbi:WSC domain-containing protein [Xylogone sp. PMI_703]|nr:WSC domain-containing protein [Xylogone sp. PMI_703]